MWQDSNKKLLHFGAGAAMKSLVGGKVVNEYIYSRVRKIWQRSFDIMCQIFPGIIYSMQASASDRTYVVWAECEKDGAQVGLTSVPTWHTNP